MDNINLRIYIQHFSIDDFYDFIFYFSTTSIIVEPRARRHVNQVVASNVWFLRSILPVTNMNVFRHISVLDTSIFI
jgi:hypothetical protein